MTVLWWNKWRRCLKEVLCRSSIEAMALKSTVEEAPRFLDQWLVDCRSRLALREWRLQPLQPKCCGIFEEQPSYFVRWSCS
ncbi:hypothetical protein M758_UG260700 [Ceratodon purpureus]|nr:hypothetical protein M758_UG260700 [Ceratodon purpureus]